MINSFEENLSIKETWKDIKGYEGLYQVSNIGRVKSLERETFRKDGKKLPLKERILKLRPNKDGYLRVQLCNGSGKTKNFFVHRLVCEAFHENPKNKPCVNHINEDKSDNRACNLALTKRTITTEHTMQEQLKQKANQSVNTRQTVS